MDLCFLQMVGLLPSVIAASATDPDVVAPRPHNLEVKGPELLQLAPPRSLSVAQ
jgi:hypothetical protein